MIARPSVARFAVLSLLVTIVAFGQGAFGQARGRATEDTMFVDEDGTLVDEFGMPIEDESDVDDDIPLLPAQGARPGMGQVGRGQAGPVQPQALPVSKPKKKLKPLPTSAFQNFIHMTTGRLLPLYGVAAFEQSHDFRPPRAATVSADYLLGPGDEIMLSVTGVTDVNAKLVVDREGRITLPKVGTVSVMGVKAAELEPFLEKQLKRSFKNFTLAASLGALRNIEVYVVGQARLPGRHSVSALSSFVTAVMSSGGPNENGSLRKVELVRGGVTVATIDVYAFLTTGKVEKDERVLAGDTIVFPPASARVALVGDVHAPAVFELAENDEPVGGLIALTGGLPSTTDRKRATIERIDPLAMHPRSIVALALDDAGMQTPLKDGDVVTFLAMSPAYDNAVTLRGAVAQPLRYPFTAGMRVRDLVPDKEALISPDYYRRKNVLVQYDDTPPPKVKRGDPIPVPTPTRAQSWAGAENSRSNAKFMLDEINWEYAAIERLDKETLTTKLVPFHLGKAVLQGDSADNLALQPGDVVTIYSANDLKVPQAKRTRLVRIEGEIVKPGIYALEAGETLPKFIERFGGLTAQAYMYGTTLRRESVRQAQAQTLAKVVEQLEAELKAHLSQRQANLPASGEPAQMAAFQQQIEFETRVGYERIEALRTSTPEGRVSLELDPEEPKLPDILLEDGDTVVIPTLPSYVTILGAVHNENGLVWREGRTVGDYLSLAGTRPNADLDNLYVLRADGSVKSRDRGFWQWIPAQNHGLELQPGDVVIVPERLDLESGYTILVRGLRDWTTILANMGVTIASMALLFRP